MSNLYLHRHNSVFRMLYFVYLLWCTLYLRVWDGVFGIWDGVFCIWDYVFGILDGVFEMVYLELGVVYSTGIG